MHIVHCTIQSQAFNCDTPVFAALLYTCYAKAKKFAMLMPFFFENYQKHVVYVSYFIHFFIRNVYYISSIFSLYASNICLNILKDSCCHCAASSYLPLCLPLLSTLPWRKEKSEAIYFY